MIKQGTNNIYETKKKLVKQGTDRNQRKEISHLVGEYTISRGRD